MVLDLYSLTMLVYYTGTIETPLYMLFVFHVIIGSFILPGFIIYSITATIIVIFSSLAYLEYFTVITHHSVAGLLNTPLYNELNYVASFTTVFAFVMVISVLLSNRIAKQLYKMEQDLLESFDKLNKAEIEKQKYIIGVVHEIKNPLTAVHSYLNIILQKILGPLDSRIEEKLKRASIRSEEAVNLTNNILKISKLRLLDQISFEKIDINKIICDSINKNSINISTKNIKLNYRDNRIKVNDIYGDPLMIELAISNLMNNAIKYVGRDGSVAVSVNDGDKGIEIEVCDNGVGIPAGEIEKIFHEFYRASNIVQRTPIGGENLSQRDGFPEGSGLGLSIVKLIVESHNGTVKVESPSRIGTKENPGTSFRIFLPSNSENAHKE